MAIDPDLPYQIALTQVPHIGCVHAKVLAQHFKSAKEMFDAKQSLLEKIEGIGTVRARSIKAFRDFSETEQEIRFIEKFSIQPLFITHNQYPQRLLHCYDPPIVLYYKGTADLNSSKIISIVGTRGNTEYSKKMTEKLIAELEPENIVVISGMAYGVDGLAHRACIKNKLATIGVLAHGLDQIYPPDHYSLAREMINNGGGLLTEFGIGTRPDKHNFPTRNRIVAGMSDATIVIESGIKGGSMVTADLANGYNKDVFAVPGKVTDNKSAGCNYLIKTNKAILLTDAQQFVEAMGWKENSERKTTKIQREMFVELNKDEKTIVEILTEKELVHIDEINLRCSVSSSTIAAAILNLELLNLVIGMPGKIYKLA